MHRFTNFMTLEQEARLAAKVSWVMANVVLALSSICIAWNLILDPKETLFGVAMPWLALCLLDWIFTCFLYHGLVVADEVAIKSWVIYSCFRILVLAICLVPPMVMRFLEGDEFWENILHTVFIATMGYLRLKTMFLLNAVSEKVYKKQYRNPWKHHDPPDPALFGPNDHWFYCRRHRLTTRFMDYEVAYEAQLLQALAEQDIQQAREQQRGARRRRGDDRARSIRTPAATRGNRQGQTRGSQDGGQGGGGDDDGQN